MVAGAAGEAAGVWASVVGLGVSTGVVEVFSTGEDVVSGVVIAMLVVVGIDGAAPPTLTIAGADVEVPSATLTEVTLDPQ